MEENYKHVGYLAYAQGAFADQNNVTPEHVLENLYKYVSGPTKRPLSPKTPLNAIAYGLHLLADQRNFVPRRTGHKQVDYNLFNEFITLFSNLDAKHLTITKNDSRQISMLFNALHTMAELKRVMPANKNDNRMLPKIYESVTTLNKIVDNFCLLLNQSAQFNAETVSKVMVSLQTLFEKSNLNHVGDAQRSELAKMMRNLLARMITLKDARTGSTCLEALAKIVRDEYIPIEQENTDAYINALERYSHWEKTDSREISIAIQSLSIFLSEGRCRKLLSENDKKNIAASLERMTAILTTGVEEKTDSTKDISFALFALACVSPPNAVIQMHQSQIVNIKKLVHIYAKQNNHTTEASNSVLRSIKKLIDYGHIEKLGNEDRAAIEEILEKIDTSRVKSELLGELQAQINACVITINTCITEKDACAAPFTILRTSRSHSASPVATSPVETTSPKLA